jgi:tetratricopeptide (TPR) repeat protein/HEAT repeat protein
LVRSWLFALWLSALVPVAAVSIATPARADFDPTGRGKKKPKPPKPAPGAPKPPKPAAGAPDDAAGRGPSQDALIARYTAIALAQPAAPFPVQRLAQLYRERDGNLKGLVAELEKRAADGSADAWSAKVALAGVYKQDGRYDDAIRTYEAAISERPGDPAPLLALGALSSDRGDKAAARAHFEKALPLLKVPADSEQTTRTLLGLCLDLQDFEGAKRHHEALVKASGASLFVKAELGRELMGRGLHERAEVELREMVKAAAGDSRALAPALRDLGQALAKQRKMDEALVTLKKALAVAGPGAGIRAEILAIMTDAYRADGKLAELLAILEAEPGQDFQRLVTMGRLYEETGDVEKALVTYRKALAIDGRNIDARLRLVHLLQTAGELDLAIREYEALIKAAPNNPDFVFELCETLIQRGDRPKALRLLTELEARASREDEILARVADFYERVDEKERALKVLQRLAVSSAGDPQYLIDLGDRYYQAGDKKRALETWARIRAVVPGKGRAAAALGEVYLDHDMAPEALAALREAIDAEPENVRYQKALALAIERTASSAPNPSAAFREARGIWEALLAKAANDKLLARESRSHIVSLWGLLRELPTRVAPLQQRFGQTPPDLESGRLLAEVQRKLGRLEDAEATLRRVTTLAPGDDDSLLALERVLVQRQDLVGAIAILKKLVEVDPKRARELYQRMAQYAAELYRDDEAVEYAARAVELSPEDAGGHEKLGDMYRRRQDTARAIAEYRQAIAKNDRLFTVYFDLAELLLSAGQVEEADRLFRRVVRAAADEELIARAGRLSMQVNLGRGSLDVLERELLPAAVGNPQRGIYRTLLVELYGALTLPLVQKVRHGGRADGEDDAKKARAELARIGARAVKPLLDALADPRESQQKVAIMVLAYVENKNAGPALFNYATGSAEKSLRVRAMLACGALRDPALLPRFAELLAPKAGGVALSASDALAVAAAWGVARVGGREAEGLLVTLLGSPSPDVRALAAVGLGLSKDRKHAAALSALVRSPEAGGTARAAAALALGEVESAAAPAETLSTLLAVADASEPLLQKAALRTLARLAPRARPETRALIEGVIARAVFSQDEEIAADAVIAATVLGAGERARSSEALPVPDGALSVREVLKSFAARSYGPEERARALVALGPALEKAAVAAVMTSPERARVVADLLLGGEAGASFAAFVEPGAALPEDLARGTREVGGRIAAAVVAGFVALGTHPSLEVRTRAIDVLAGRPEAAAQAAVVAALSDPEEAVRRAALSAVGEVPGGAVVAAVADIARSAPEWSLRARAAEALGRLARGSSDGSIAAALGDVARKDSYSLVREAAVGALGALPRAAADPVLREVAEKDAEPRVRAAAAALLGRGG